MKSHTKEINASIRYIKHHFNVDGWPLSYNLQLPELEFMLFALSEQERIEYEMEFIGKLLDINLTLTATFDGIKIVKLREEYV